MGYPISTYELSVVRTFTLALEPAHVTVRAAGGNAPGFVHGLSTLSKGRTSNLAMAWPRRPNIAAGFGS
jgi:hypothetical protein